MAAGLDRRFYIAYGSNLNIAHMRVCCPSAVVAGTTTLAGWELMFRGWMDCAYLTIEPREGGTVPMAVWSITPGDERALDDYEGYPSLYYKQMFNLTLDSGADVTAFAYIMQDGYPCARPEISYVVTCMEGYDAFGFDRQVLLDALARCAGNA